MALTLLFLCSKSGCFACMYDGDCFAFLWNDSSESSFRTFNFKFHLYFAFNFEVVQS